MTLREFFAGRAIVFVLLLLIGCVVFAYTTYAPTHRFDEVSESSNGEKPSPVSFAWTFSDDRSLNLDGLSQTNVILSVTYPDGSVQDTKVDTVPGGCSVLPDPKEGSLSGTTVAQCYYAGLGYRYRVVTGETGYRVERKAFEEASPEYDPPQEEYETLMELPR